MTAQFMGKIAETVRLIQLARRGEITWAACVRRADLTEKGEAIILGAPIEPWTVDADIEAVAARAVAAGY